jgi:hypothetical protein
VGPCDQATLWLVSDIAHYGPIMQNSNQAPKKSTGDAGLSA